VRVASDELILVAHPAHPWARSDKAVSAEEISRALTRVRITDLSIVRHLTAVWARDSILPTAASELLRIAATS
jgi:hypothetical protein